MTGTWRRIRPCPLAVLRAFGADFGAFTAGMFVVWGVNQHEMRRRPAHFGAGHHQAEVLGLDMLSARLEAMVQCHGEARPVATHAEIDAAGHLFGMRHLVSLPLAFGCRPLSFN
jgi:hypothetical protein